MQYRLLGRSGLRVSELCLGTMTFGKDWGWGASKEESRKLFDAFAAAGGNFIDTASNYIAYQQLLDEFGTDYRQVDHQFVVDDAALARFYGGPTSVDRLPNQQVLDLEGVAGRLFSTSYTPGIDDPRRAPMRVRLEEIFAAHAVDGRVVMEYDTELYLGQIAAQRLCISSR